MEKTENLGTLEKTGGRERKEIQVPLGEKVVMAPRVSVAFLVSLDPRALQASQGQWALLARVFLVVQEARAPRVTVGRLDPKGSRASLESVACEESLEVCRMWIGCWKLLASRCLPCGRSWRPGMRALVASCLCPNDVEAPRGTQASGAPQARRAPSASLENAG